MNYKIVTATKRVAILDMLAAAQTAEANHYPGMALHMLAKIAEKVAEMTAELESACAAALQTEG